MRFKDKVVLITGAAGGIGRETAAAFAAEGARLSLVDLEGEPLERVRQELGLAAERCLLLTADVTDEAQVEAYVRQTREKWGRIDVFFNNAGVEGGVAILSEYPSEALDRVINVNFKGAFYGLKHVLRVMKEQGSGVVVNVSSIAGLKGLPFTSAYNATKAAVISLTKTAAVEFAPFGIRVNAVCPALVNTRMMRSLEAGFSPEDPEAARRQLAEKVPLGRYSEPREVAAAVLFLASEESSFITGTALEVVGGMTA
jgi:NAD(P)-dependent dehydrogenase (short-subunit alcohol dehydrogenase family)